MLKSNKHHDIYKIKFKKILAIEEATNNLTRNQWLKIETRNNQWRYGPEDVPYDSNDGMRTSVWGPAAWLLLACIGRNFPVHPTNKQRIDHHTFLISFGNVLPCGACRTNFITNLAVAGYNPYIHLLDRHSFSSFINHLHNIVNKMLGKKITISYDEHRDTFDAFRAKCPEKKTNKYETGCTGDVVVNDQRATCLISIIPEKMANKTRSRNGNRTMIINRKCKLTKKYGKK